MVRYFIKRPVAVLMSFLALTILGLISIGKIPVSLLPNVDVPEIVIRVNYPNTSAAVLEQNVLRPIRENMLNILGLKNIESKSANHLGLVNLTFDYNTNMKLAYIEVNEKLDRLNTILPREMPRPQVMRINTSDIPVIRVQVIPKTVKDFGSISKLAEKILKRRLEQVDGVGFVDINGLQQEVITITPIQEQLISLGLNELDIISAIQNANTDVGGLSVKDGQYRYFVKLENKLSSLDNISRLPIKTKDETVVQLGKLVTLNKEVEQPVGFHIYDGKQGIVLTIEKQAESRMNELVPKIKNLVIQFQKDYPDVEFTTTQDQTFLMDAGISNLKQDLLIGGFLAVSLLFLFMGNWISPTLMSISIPLSLIFTFIFFYFFKISFNIISLSGLTLGIGTLIDNSIIVIDRITSKRQSGLSMEESSVVGTNEVITPVISQVLTTVAVYAPLILIGGIASTLIFDQSIALTISLCVSLLIAFILTPLLYNFFLKTPPEKLKEDTLLFKWISNKYHRMIHQILKHKAFYATITILLMPIGFYFASLLPVSSLPQIEKRESLLQVDWNAPIDARENKRRMERLFSFIKEDVVTSESEIGIQQFLFQQKENSIENSEMYLSFENEDQKMKVDDKIKKWFNNHYHEVSISIIDAPNAFTQLFVTNTPYLEARFTPKTFTGSESKWSSLSEILKRIRFPNFKLNEGLINEQSVNINLDMNKMILYGVSREVIEDKLRQLFGIYTISEIKNFGDVNPVRLKSETPALFSQVSSTVKGLSGINYPLTTFIEMEYSNQPKFITSDKSGEYKSIMFEKDIKDVQKLEKEIDRISSVHGYNVEFTGRFYENKGRQSILIQIFLIVILLLYVILAIQYESLFKPFVVMLTIPLGIAGSMFLLWATGGTLDVMAGVGLVVILGLVVDDPVLKVETLTRLEKKYAAEGLKKDDKLLERMIHEAGHICLKPVLLTTLTTSFALVPVLFIPGIGNDLQKPLAIVIIGGLTIGTFFTLWFVPLAYWYASKWKLI